MWNNQLGSCVLGRYQCGNKIQLEEEKVEEKGEEVEDGDDVRRSPWLNLVIRASRGVLWEGDTRRLGLLMVFCNFLTSVHRRTTITVFQRRVCKSVVRSWMSDDRI